MEQNRPTPADAEPMPSNGNNGNETVPNEAPPPVQATANASRAGAAIAPLPMSVATPHATSQQFAMLPNNILPPPPAAVGTATTGTAIATSINAATANTPQTSNTTGGGGGRVSFAGVGNNLQNDFAGMPTLEPNPNYIGIPTLPPLGASIDTAVAFTSNMQAGWTCECGATYPSSRKRCKCGKWRGGKRAPYQRKKKSAGESSNESITATSATSNSSSAGVGHPVVNEVNVTTNNQNDSVSPMTATRDDGSIGGSTVSSTSTVTVMETNEMIRQLISNERQEVGDGGDSDEEGDGFETMNELGTSAVEAHLERSMHDSDEIENNVRDDVDNCIVSDLQNITISTDNDAANNVVRPLFGAPTGWTPPKQPDNFVHVPNTELGEPPHETLDNPAKWSAYTFKAKFEGKGAQRKYVGNQMPAGAKPCPKDPTTGKRISNGYEFFYDGWKHPAADPSPFSRAGATKENLFPPDREAKLDADLLRKMGLTRERMLKKDALFFIQLLMPMVDPSMSGIAGDPRKAFHTVASNCTTLYANGVKKWNGDYGHYFQPVTAEEMVNWDGIVARNRNKCIGDSWDTTKTAAYDETIAGTMTLRRWQNIKSAYKLIEYYNETKRGDPNYDPTQKYRLAWDAPIYNINQFIKKGGKDVTVDETTWPNSSFSDQHGILHNKPAGRGGQNTLAVDARKRYVYAYTSRHKFHTRPQGFTQEGPAEVVRLVQLLDPLVISRPKEEADTRRQIFEGPVHFGMDNHFSGDNVTKFLGERGYGATMTCRRDRLPVGVDKKFFHHIKAVQVNQVSRAARFEQPVIAFKHVNNPPDSGKSSYSLVHVSFQSTGSCNISTVNSLSEVQLYVRERQRGRGEQKRRWAIEMNEGREVYLKTYSAVDKIDQMLKEWYIFYVCWKWWHAAMRHGKAIAYCMAYQMYLDCATGGVDEEFKIDDFMTAPEFRAQGSEQMCNYRASNMMYPGDEKLRKTTSRNSKKRGKKRKHDEIMENGGVAYDDYIDAKYPRGRSAQSRLCSDNLTLLKAHLNSFTKVGKGRCQICGNDCFTKCGICDVHVCYKSSAKMSSVSCSIDFHNDHYFGLALCDRVNIFEEKKKNFKAPSSAAVKRNTAHINKLKRQRLQDELDNEDSE